MDDIFFKEILDKYIEESLDYNLDSKIKDLGLDSLDLGEFVLDLSNEYDFPLDDMEKSASKMKTVRDVYNLVKPYYDKRSETIRSL